MSDSFYSKKTFSRLTFWIFREQNKKLSVLSDITYRFLYLLSFLFVLLERYGLKSGKKNNKYLFVDIIDKK